jgi:hypothetical protein
VLDIIFVRKKLSGGLGERQEKSIEGYEVICVLQGLAKSCEVCTTIIKLVLSTDLVPVH